MARKRTGRRSLRYTFCIAGTQKAATTSLSSMLNQHPNVRRAPRKEMHFFDREDRDWSAPDHSDLQRRAGAGHKILGDGTPVYLWWPHALERIRAYDPSMKFLVTFRDPIERLFSHWVMNLERRPDIALDWPDFITTFAPHGLEEHMPDGVGRTFYRVNSGVVRGYYGQQLTRAFQLFDPGQFHLIEFRSFLADHRSHLDRVTAFLGLPAYQEHPRLPHWMAGRDSVVGTAPTRDDVERLAALYQADFERFKDISGLDVSSWPLQHLLDGKLDPAELAARFARRVVAPDDHSGRRRGQNS